MYCSIHGEIESCKGCWHDGLCDEQDSINSEKDYGWHALIKKEDK